MIDQLVSLDPTWSAFTESDEEPAAVTTVIREVLEALETQK
jgi:hypothetical protein